MPHRLPTAAAAFLLATTAFAIPPRLAPKVDAITGARMFELWDGSVVTVGREGLITRSKEGTRGGRLFPVFAPPQADDLSLLRILSIPRRELAVDRVVPGTRPEFWVGSMAIEPRSLEGYAPLSLSLARAAAATTDLPSNYGLRTSLQAHLNAAGVNAVGAFADLSRRYGQLPGQGVRITNVSVGDLTDQAMADKGDFYVQIFGPSTRVIAGQRYLDYPSLPLIPTWTSDARGRLDPLGTVELVDPYLSEILLDFSVMAPLPSDRQRPDARGNGFTDLLGIAPGAEYRLIVPQDPTISNIYAALQAAATQQPRPDVITASLGFGFDGVGYPGRYLEDDPLGQSVIAGIVGQGIVVCISSNDGTRLFTPTAVGPDGGSAPTERLRPGETPTSTADDFASTVATRVQDSGAIAVGGTTLDDIFSAPPQAGGELSRVGQFPETRFNGATSFSSGFGSRIDIAAPSDNIVALAHLCTQYPCTPQDAIPVLSGGTSASAPMVAAAAAVIIQGARLMHRSLTPWQVRDILVRTGRPLPQAPQSGRVLSVGPQLDVTAALESVLGADGAPSIARLSVAHRREVGELGASFREDADPSAIDLSGPEDYSGSTGQWLAGPITIAADVLNATSDLKYALIVGRTELVQDRRAFRLLPAELLSAAGLQVVASAPRGVDVRYEIRSARKVVASTQIQLVFGPSDGLITEPLAPVAPAVAVEGQDVVVQYDVSGLRFVDSPSLIVSGIGHWSPRAAPLFHVETEIPLERPSGHVRIAAAVFRGGAGLYGIAIRPQATYPDIGQVAVIRIAARSPGRPDAPLVADGSGRFGHIAAVSRAAPRFSLRWDAASFGDGAQLEFSAPAPSLRNSYNTYTNANGSRRDSDGVNSPSAVFVPLPASSGQKVFDAVQLGLAPGIFYNVRVFATHGGALSSEASPTSALEVDDIALPAGNVTSFDLSGEASLAATMTTDAFGNLATSALVRWSPQQAALGGTLSSDKTGKTFYEMIGSDLSRSIALAARWPWNGSVQIIETWDTSAGHRLGKVNVDAWSQDWLLTARVDSARHRAAFLAYDPNFAPVLLPFDLVGGAFGQPVPAPQDSRSFYNLLALDPLNGKAFITAGAVTDFCLFRSGPLVLVDLDTAATASAAIDSCTTAFVPDGRTVHVTHGPLLSNGVLLPVARLQDVNEQTLEAGNSVPLGPRSPLFVAVDPDHQLLVVAFIAGEDFYVNSNATSAVAAYNLLSGKTAFYSTSFNFAQAAFGSALSPLSLRGIQLDPATRTGWTFAPGSTQLQRFSY